MPTQQTLDLSIKSCQTFENFVSTTNRSTKEMVKFFLSGSSDAQILLLKGGPGIGKSHLMHASCHHIQQSGGRASFISSNNPQAIYSIIKSPQPYDLVCVDNLQQAQTHPTQEQALFHLYNHIELTDTRLIWAINSDQSSPFARKDLNSRFKATLSVELMPYSPDDILFILKQCINDLQINLSDDICLLLINEYTRSIPGLLKKITEIEQYACSQQSKITLRMCRMLIDPEHPRH